MRVDEFVNTMLESMKFDGTVYYDIAEDNDGDVCLYIGKDQDTMVDYGDEKYCNEAVATILDKIREASYLRNITFKRVTCGVYQILDNGKPNKVGHPLMYKLERFMDNPRIGLERCYFKSIGEMSDEEKMQLRSMHIE